MTSYMRKGARLMTNGFFRCVNISVRLSSPVFCSTGTSMSLLHHPGGISLPSIVPEIEKETPAGASINTCTSAPVPRGKYISISLI